MEQLSTEKLKIIEDNLKRIQEHLVKFGYKRLPLDRSEFIATNKIFEAKTENQSADRECIGDISRIFENQWNINIFIYHHCNLCNLAALLPDLDCRNLASELNFENTMDIAEFQSRCEKATDVMIKIINTDFKPYLLGEKWQHTPTDWSKFPQYF